jgi:hypothetical protein
VIAEIRVNGGAYFVVISLLVITKSQRQCGKMLPAIRANGKGAPCLWGEQTVVWGYEDTEKCIIMVHNGTVQMYFN